MTLKVFKTPSLGRRLATATIVAFAGLGLAGCGDDTSLTSNNSGGNTSNAQPKGDLTGTVIDTNSTPIPGATVNVAGLTTTTDAQGQWRINNVPVVNTEDNSGTPDVDGEGIALTVVITPPTGYLGGIAEITPEAQTVSSQNEQSSGDNSEGQTNPQLLWLDGYLVSTGPIALPKLAATVKILSVKDAASGTPIAGGKVALDFNSTNSGLNDETNAGINFQPTGISFNGTLDANGSITFTALPENSSLNLLIEDYDFTDCGNSGLEDLDPSAPCGSQIGKACTKGAAKPVAKATNAGDICFISTNREVRPITYTEMKARLLEASGDLVHPFLVNATGVFNDVSAFDGDDYRDVDNTSPGLLSDGINQSFTFNFSENLATVTAANVLVFNEDTDSYISGFTIDQTNKKKLIVNLAAPVDAGTTLKFYFLLPQFHDVAGNFLLSEPNTQLSDPVGYDGSQIGDICEGQCPNVSYIYVRLCIYEEPSTNPGSVVAVQEKIDPRLNGASNDDALNQTRSVSFNDVRDANKVPNQSPFYRLTQQVNNPDDLVVTVDVMNALGFAFNLGTSEVTDVDNNVARVEFDPIDGFDTYLITVDHVAGGTSTLTTSNFPLNSYNDCGSPGFIDNCETASVLRDSVLKYAFMYEDANEGDLITIQALDDLGNPGQLSNEVIIADNVEPTVALQSSYQDLHDYPAGVEDSADVADDASGCFVRPTPVIVVDGDNETTVHAGVKSFGGVDDGGTGGEVTNPGSDATVGNVCIGISPELIIDASGDSDGNISTAHNELVAGREPSNAILSIAAFPEAYDAQAFGDWTAANRTSIMGIAFTEGLSSVGTPSFTGTSGLLSGYLVQNETNGKPTVNSIVRADTQYLVSVNVSDALALANGEHDEVLGFVGATDESGNAATAAAAPFLSIRDEWAPYVVTAVRNELGDLVVTFNEPVVIEDNDRFDFDDGVANGTDISVVLDVDAPNFTQTVGGTVITVDSLDLPAGFGNVFSNPVLTYDDSNGTDTTHALMDWRSIADEQGNSWTVYARSFADSTPFNDDVPVFIVPDLIGIFRVDVGTETVLAGATEFVFELVATHPICNLDAFLGESCPNVSPGELFDLSVPGYCSNELLLGVADVTCQGAFVANYLSVGANCSLNAASSGAVISADLQHITFSVTCNTPLVLNDIIGLNLATVGNSGVAVSELDDTQIDSALDTTAAEAP